MKKTLVLLGLSSVTFTVVVACQAYGSNFGLANDICDKRHNISDGGAPSTSLDQLGREVMQTNWSAELEFKESASVQHHPRITEPTLCDPTVQQYSGYIDIATNKHLFFWFFESRYSPSTDPLILWFNGGPGASSATGVLAEIGPCTVAEEGKSTTRNLFSWNTNANVLFLDQPVNTGFSYAGNGASVSNSIDAAQDVLKFLELFFSKFPKYADLPLHIATESYGGTYAPNIANAIHKRNKKLAKHATPFSSYPINLASIILANARADPYVQVGSMGDFLCNGPYRIFDDPDGPECTTLRTTTIPTCQRLIKACYEDGLRSSCGAAATYCMTHLYKPLWETGFNPNDARKKCDRSDDKDGPFCYTQFGRIETYMNQPHVKAELGVDRAQEFKIFNADVNKAFELEGDMGHNSALLLPELINDGVRLLVIAGNTDMFCDFIGQERWVKALSTKFTEDFLKANTTLWMLHNSNRTAGTVRSAGDMGNITLVTVHEAGHMVPLDQPEAALDLVNRWTKGESLSVT